MTPHRAAILACLVVILLMDKFPPWAEWVSFVILLILFVWPIADWSIRRIGRVRTFKMRVTDTGKETGESYVSLRITARRPIRLSRASLVFSDSKKGERTRHRGDLHVLDVTDGNSPSDLYEGAVIPSYALVELRFVDDALRVGPDDELAWFLRYSTSQPWSGYLVFFANDEDGRRRSVSVPIEIRHPPASVPVAASAPDSADGPSGGTPDTDDRKNG